eukprot:124890-Chlamydomonas_euryale.AAC.2
MLSGVAKEQRLVLVSPRRWLGGNSGWGWSVPGVGGVSKPSVEYKKCDEVDRRKQGYGLPSPTQCPQH